MRIQNISNEELVSELLKRLNKRSYEEYEVFVKNIALKSKSDRIKTKEEIELEISVDMYNKRKEGMKVSEIAKKYGVTRQSVYNKIKKLDNK